MCENELVVEDSVQQPAAKSICAEATDVGNGLARRNRTTKTDVAIKKKWSLSMVDQTAKHRFPVFDLDSFE